MEASERKKAVYVENVNARFACIITIRSVRGANSRERSCVHFASANSIELVAQLADEIDDALHIGTGAR